MLFQFKVDDKLIHNFPPSYQTLRKGTGIPMYQALEKQYNKPAKCPSGVIRFTKQKQAVCKWNIIKHKKLFFTEVLTKICAVGAEDQYSLHHDFSKCTADSERAAVEKMVSCINERGNPFDISVTVTKTG